MESEKTYLDVEKGKMLKRMLWGGLRRLFETDARFCVRRMIRKIIFKDLRVKDRACGSKMESMSFFLKRVAVFGYELSVSLSAPR